MLRKNQYSQIIPLLMSAAVEQIWKRALKDCVWFVSPSEADLRAKVPFRLSLKNDGVSWGHNWRNCRWALEQNRGKEKVQNGANSLKSP